MATPSPCPEAKLSGEHGGNAVATISRQARAARTARPERITVDFTLPEHLPGLLAQIDDFIEAEIKPLERDNIQYFDHRREFTRTDLDRGGIPRRDWEDLLDEMRRRADAAGWLRYGLPSHLGGRDGSNLDMAVIREHLAHKGLGLHNDLQNENSIVGNFPQVIMMDRFGTNEQQSTWCEALITGERSMAFGLTERGHGSDATWLETRAELDGDDWVINGAKRFNTGVHRATHDLIFARTSGQPGQAGGITAFLVPTDAPGFRVPFYWWTFNMPSDHAEVELTDVRVGRDAVFGEVDHGLEVGQTFLHENRIRQAAASLGAAQYCIDRAASYAAQRVVFGKPLSVNQAVQWPLVELRTEAQMVRLLVYYAAWNLDRNHHMEVSDKVSMANYRANRLVCDAADRAIQVHGGVGYSRHQPFEHIYRHHRRYRITEGSEEIQIRRVAQRMLKFGSKAR
jgi:alkylation response protein AidB-like acyl-CoA dehydrogenase